MTPAGWIFMLGSLACVLTLVVYCFSRLLRSPAPVEDRVHAPLDIDTQDRET